MAPRTEEEISPLPSSASERSAQRRFSVRSVPGGAAPSSAFKMASAPADPMPLCERSTDVRTPLVSARHRDGARVADVIVREREREQRAVAPLERARELLRHEGPEPLAVA